MNPICRDIRKDILKISRASGHGHLPTCFSVIEMIFAVYQNMRHDPKNPRWDERDIFILSKGHASLGLYCVLARMGYFETEKVYKFGAFNSDFGCHADRFKVPGVEASTGSLGHGIGLAVGAALGFKLKKSDRRVFVIVGDGESNEGSVWEAVMVAMDQKLDNITVLYDHNLSQRRCLQIYHPAEQFRGFGADVTEVDGHNLAELKEQIQRRSDRLKVIIAHTKKGYGCKTFVENVFEWHRRSPNEQEFEMLMKELDEETV